MDGSSATTTIVLGGERVQVPTALVEDREVFSQVMNMDTLTAVLSGEEGDRLKELLPKNESLKDDDVISALCSGQCSRFGMDPLEQFQDKLCDGQLSPEVQSTTEQLQQLMFHQYQLNQSSYYVNLLQEILVSRQHLLQNALCAGAIESQPITTPGRGEGGEGPIKEGGGANRHRKRTNSLRKRAEYKFRKLMADMRKECGQTEDIVSSDEDDQPLKLEHLLSDHQLNRQPVNEDDYHHILRRHRKKRLKNKAKYNEIMSGVSYSQLLQHHQPNQGEDLTCVHMGDEDVSLNTVSKKSTRPDKEVGVVKREVGGVRNRRKTVKEKVQHEVATAAQTKAIFEVYRPIDEGTVKEGPLQPVVLEGPLPTGKFMCFFSILKSVFESLSDKKGELSKLAKNLRQVLRSSDCHGCQWIHERQDWAELTLSAVCYLAGEVGAVSSFVPLPHFIPLVDFRDRIDHWKWIGHGRDSELELLILCNHWYQNLDKALPVVDYSDYEPPSPHVWTRFVFRPSTHQEIMKFRRLEQERYACPHKAYTYSVHGFESPVGPVKGARVTKKDSSKARGHALLVPNRPNCVTILSLVRDATSRLPNGEGTRIDLCVLVQDSQYLADSVSDTQLNNAVSGALDRLHYEKDPCVRYDGPRKVWIYLHRGRTEEDFERIYWACEVAAKQRKMLTGRPKIKPKIIVRTNGKEEVVEQGCVIKQEEETGKTSKRTGKTAVAQTPSGGGGGGGGGGVLLQAAPKSSMIPTSTVVVTNVIQGEDAPGIIPSSSGTGVGVVVQKQVITNGSGVIGQPEERANGAKNSQKPSRKRKPTQKVVEQQKQQMSSKVKVQTLTTAAATAAATTSFTESEWDSSEEEPLLPFLDSSLVSHSNDMSRDSVSSWPSSDSEGNDGSKMSAVAMTTSTPTAPTPNFLSNIGIEGSDDVIGGELVGPADEGGKGSGPPGGMWLSGSPNNNSSD